jgi:PAS domain S-box-containing protein
VEQSVSLSALPEYERRFRSAFEHAAIGMAIVDRSGAYVFVNQAFCRISGYQDHELYGMTFTATLHPEEGAMRLDVSRRSWRANREAASTNGASSARTAASPGSG